MRVVLRRGALTFVVERRVDAESTVAGRVLHVVARALVRAARAPPPPPTLLAARAPRRPRAPPPARRCTCTIVKIYKSLTVVNLLFYNCVVK